MLRSEWNDEDDSDFKGTENERWPETKLEIIARIYR